MSPGGAFGARASIGHANNLLKSSDGIGDTAEIAPKFAQAIGGEAHGV